MWFTGEFVNNSIRALVERQAQCAEDERAANIDLFFHFPSKQAEQQASNNKVWAGVQELLSLTAHAILIVPSFVELQAAHCFPEGVSNSTLFCLMFVWPMAHWNALNAELPFASAAVHCSLGQRHWSEFE